MGLFLSAKRHREVADPRIQEEATAAAGDETEAVEMAIRSIAEGHFHRLGEGGGALMCAARQLAQRLEARFLASLRHMVALSMEGNEAVISAATMLRQFREMDEQTRTIATASEELETSVKEIAATSKSAASAAEAAQKTAETGRKAAQEAVETIQRIAASVQQAASQVDSLAKASEQIGSVVGAIEEIASQTNLLALNATIEAARAGEAGRGFAVVANEVKSLANQTASLTVDIRERIEDLRGEIGEIVRFMQDNGAAVQQGAEMISATGERMSDVSGQIVGITDRMSEIASILSQQAEASNKVARGTSGIAEMSSRSLEGIGHTLDAVDRSEQLISEQLAELAGLDLRDAVIHLAKADHVIWKKRLASMLVGRIRLSAAELSDHHQCRLGKWYDQTDDPRYCDHPAFAALAEPHRRVHEHGRRAAALYEAGDLAGALSEIARVEETSREVVRRLDELAGSGEKNPGGLRLLQGGDG
jgi:methyl-accepting chemotaxis protein